ncbi:MAG: plasmid pRiA4b ORF-3 family protein [Kangiellaceae bacterium]|nr:plasmid pRiA4b ORF-3 family protein [Kangiellaceae bacterium]
MSENNHGMLQFKIELEHLSIPVWREILIDPQATLEDLHFCIQVVMGWADYHDHEFVIDEQHYGYIEQTGISEPDDNDIHDEAQFLLTDIFKQSEQSIRYTYDLHDHWYHKITFIGEVKNSATDEFAICLSGKNACPPEDAGGVSGYEHLLNVLKTPNHFEHADVKDWFGDSFSPTQFDLEETNNNLQAFFAQEDEDYETTN